MKPRYVLIAGQFLSQKFAYRTKVKNVIFQREGILMNFSHCGLFQLEIPYYQIQCIAVEDRRYVYFRWDDENNQPEAH